MTFHTAPDGTGVNDQGGAGNHYRDVNVKDPNANYGFLIDSPQGVTIDRSVASNTRYAGVYIQNNARSDGYGATVTRTKADGNTDYGMYAVSKGTKASGNSAESNGVANCFQIDCGEAAKASAPAAPNCGDTITQDVKLKADLELLRRRTRTAASRGQFGAAGVTVDLNGHLILGDGSTSCSGSRAAVSTR